jgi:hypothetical protein
MVNDEHGILLGLYRESSSSETIEENANFIRKRIVIHNQDYEIHETMIDRKRVWKVFMNSEELSREEILYLFAEANLRRQMKYHF